MHIIYFRKTGQVTDVLRRFKRNVIIIIFSIMLRFYPRSTEVAGLTGLTAQNA